MSVLKTLPYLVLAFLAALAVLFTARDYATLLTGDFDRAEVVGVSRVTPSTSGSGQHTRAADSWTLLCLLPESYGAPDAARLVSVVSKPYEDIERAALPPQGDTVWVWIPSGAAFDADRIAGVDPDRLTEVHWGVSPEADVGEAIGREVLVFGAGPLGDAFTGSFFAPGLVLYVIITAILGLAYGFMIGRGWDRRTVTEAERAGLPPGIGVGLMLPILNVALFMAWMFAVENTNFATPGELMVGLIASSAPTLFIAAVILRRAYAEVRSVASTKADATA